MLLLTSTSLKSLLMPPWRGLLQLLRKVALLTHTFMHFSQIFADPGMLWRCAAPEQPRSHCIPGP